MTGGVRLTERTEISAVNYGNISGGKMMFALNAYSIPRRKKN
jgi:hypothetical protein